MLRMCSELGFTVEGDPDDVRLTRVVLDLNKATSSAPRN